jgi:hypothetical protein
MKNKRVTSLKDVKTLEVSLVEAGANLKRRFHVLKSRGKNMTPDEILVEILKTEGKSEAVAKLEELLKEDTPEDAKAAMMSAMKLLEAYSDMVPVKEALAALRGASGEEPEPEVVEAMAEDETEKEEAEKQETDEDELKKSLESLPESARSAMQAIWKSNEELVKKQAKLEQELGEELAKSARREYLVKAKETLCNIPGHTVEDMVDLMVDVRARDAGLGDRVEKALEAASAAMQGGPLLVEAGRNNPDMSAGDPWAKIQTLAKSEVETSGGRLTMPEAIAKTIQTNPKLYAAYNADRLETIGGR